ncbi:FAD-binding protein [Priestia megaterium]|uniref:FAD-binding oxidoreductase n=1 Tax=Priestia megaterium TaxID=1404 RepID=UPI000BF9865A|nr:FAD-binding oxidoreductase [Priestia megaterium]PFP44206.1 FAD-binding protein [Priestia megaterium]
MGLKIRLTGRVIFKGDPGYEQARQNWNPYVDTFPLVFVFAQSTKDVTNAIKWARKNNVPIRARSGRHALDKNLSTVKDGIVIDVSNMNKVQLIREREVAIVQTGIHIGPLVKKLAQEGFMSPFGDNPTVGIGGFTMGGGMGILQRSIGFMSDNLIGLEMVDANGIVLNANKNKNSDLLWASRGGGGGNFGINTEYRFKVHHAPAEATVFEIIWPWNQLEEVFKAWQKWAPFVDNRLGSILEIFSKNNGFLHATGLFLGSKTKLTSLLEPLTSVGTPTRVFIQELSYPNVVEHLMPDGSIPGRVDQNYKLSSAWATCLFPDEAIKIMRTFLEESNGTESSFFFLNCGGAVSRISPEATAFFWRSPKFYLEWNTTWTQDSEASRNLALVARTHQLLNPFVEGAYVNSPDQYIINFGPAYYGTNFDRLQRIKAKYDPENVFHFPQSIPPKF